MPSRKEAQSSRIGQHMDRRHSSTERANTARVDDEHCNVALQQINTMDDLPAPGSIESSATESETLRRLQHPAYELSEEPAASQSHISLSQRPKSPAPLPEDEGFTFSTRQDRQINIRIGRPQQIRPTSPAEQSTRRMQGAEKANGTPHREKHRCVADHSTFKTNSETLCLSVLPVQPSDPAELVPKDSATTIRIDLTREPPSATSNAIKLTNTIENTGPQQERICQEPSENIKHGLPSDNSARYGLGEAAVCYINPLSIETRPRSPLNIMPTEHRG